jgi:hypothetical protein
MRFEAHPSRLIASPRPIFNDIRNLCALALVHERFALRPDALEGGPISVAFGLADQPILMF